MPDPDSSPPLQAVTAGREAIRSERRPQLLRWGGFCASGSSGTARCVSRISWRRRSMNPQLGYYARGTRQVGRGGDFFTSVSVGPLFGELLARRFLREWRESGSPRTLADHRMRRPRRHARRRHVSARSPDSIPMPLPRSNTSFPSRSPCSRRRSGRRFAGFRENRPLPHRSVANLRPIRCPASPSATNCSTRCPSTSSSGTPDGWRECRVAIDPDGDFIWETIAKSTIRACSPPSPRWEPISPTATAPKSARISANFLEPLDPLPRIRPAALARLRLRPPGILPSGPHVRHPAHLFQTPRRRKTRLDTPGEIDITAHVDFTAVAEAAIALGGQSRDVPEPRRMAHRNRPRLAARAWKEIPTPPLCASSKPSPTPPTSAAVSTCSNFPGNPTRSCRIRHPIPPPVRLTDGKFRLRD